MHAAARNRFATVRTGRCAQSGRGFRRVPVPQRRDSRRFGSAMPRFDHAPAAVAVARPVAGEWHLAMQTFAAAFLFVSLFLA